MLKTNSSLTDLYLKGTSITTDGINLLLDALTTNNTLQRLGLDRKHKETCQRFDKYEEIKVKLQF